MNAYSQGSETVPVAGQAAEEARPGGGGYFEARPPGPAERPQSREEEWANAVTHGLGAALALVAGLVMTQRAIPTGSPLKVLCAAIFSGAMFALYAISAVYHILRPGPAKDRFQRLDRAAIAVFVAGTYTPVALLMVRGTTGAALTVVEWVLAGVAILFLWGDPGRYARRSEWLYQIMGWITILAARPFFRHTPPAVLAALALSGACYGAGVALLLRDRVKYLHAAFHVLTLVGAGLQFWAISQFVN